MTHRFRFAYLFLLAMITLPCINADLLASPGPENVAVVVNADSWASNTIANEFIHLRQVPPGNVIYLHLGQLRDFEGLNVNDFRARILQPVLDEIARRALTRQIDCIAYSSDIPFSIDCSPDIGKQKIPFFVTPTASASSLTYLYQRVLAKDIDYLSLSANNYVRRVESKRNLHPDRETGKQLAEAFKLIQDKKFEPAATLFESILKDHPGDPDLYYNLACCRANLRQYDEAMEALTKSVENGFWSARHLRNDEDLKPLHERKDFKELLAAIKPLDVSPKPAQGFRSAVGWDAEGVAGDYPDKYLLSTFLAITSGRGNSVHEAIDSLRRSASADGTQPKGTIYFMANDDVRSSTREWAFAAAAKKLKELGVGAEIIEGVLPTKKDDVAGAVVGIAGFEWKASESKILPGAICEHLTSCGGMMRQDDGQTSLTEFIRGGAAGASGAVQEPFAIQDKFPSPFIQVYYAQGSTLAEAFYQSLAGPYQMLIVGDPLCRPWAKIPLVAVSGIEPNAVVKGDVEIKASVKDEQMRVARYELYVDGQKQPGMTVATTALAEGWHELAVVAIAADAVQTRGRATLAFQVNNGGRDLGATVASAEKAPQLLIYAQEGAFDVKLGTAGRIALLHNGVEVASFSKTGLQMMKTDVLGCGPVRLQPIAYGKDAEGKETNGVWLKPLDVEVILTPQELVGLKPAEMAELAKGAVVEKRGMRPLLAEKGRPQDWLKTLGVKEGDRFSIDACFDVTAQGDHQLQIWWPGAIEATLDGQPLALNAKGWKFVPMNLGAGTHHLQLACTVKGGVDLDIRLGGPGGHTISAERLKHFPTKTPATTQAIEETAE